MYALAVLAILLLYIAGCFWFSFFVFWLARKRKWPLPWLWTFLSLVAYNLPLANYVGPPIVAMNKYCEQSGFWLLKTPAQWKHDNPGDAEALSFDDEQRGRAITGENGESINHLNQRFDWAILWSNTETKNVRQLTETLVDRKNREIVARKIDFRATAYPLYGKSSCFDKEDQSRWRVNNKVFIELKRAYENIGNDENEDK